MKKIISMLLAVFTLLSPAVQAAEKKQMDTVMLDGTTLISARDFADRLGFELMWLSNMKTVIFWNGEFEIRIQTDSPEFLVNDLPKLTDAPAKILNDRAYVPLRALAEAIGASVLWNDQTKETEIKMTGAKMLTGEIAERGNFFYQRQPDWAFDNNGNGYCWVCCYAMAISNLGKAVTPDMVAEFNQKNGSSGAFMQHNGIASEFGVQFVQAIPSESPYFDKYESWKGATYIKAETNEEAAAAIRAAIDAHPQGVMVRYTVYPHTMLAVGYSGDTVYFNDPAYENGEHIPFEETCLKNFELKDLDFLQVVE